MKRILLLLLVLCSCTPLRSVRRDENHSQEIVNTSVAEIIRAEIQRQLTSVNQTVIEFYEPSADSVLISRDTSLLPGRGIVGIPSLKRISHTQINTQFDTNTRVDSLAYADQYVRSNSVINERVIEKPPAISQTIKWVAVVICLLFLIIIMIKFF